MSEGTGLDEGVGKFSPHVALEAHARELTTVEAAILVLSPTLEDADLFAYNEEFERLHERIDGISSLLGHAENLDLVAERAAAEFAELGAALDKLLRQIRAGVRDVDIARLRPVAAKLCETRRSDVEALLDLCLCDLEDLDHIWPLVDLLIGRLATGEQDGKREMVRDPSRLTPRIWEVCQRTNEQHGEAAAGVARVFLEALNDVDAAQDIAALEELIERLYKFKDALGRKRLLPSVLRNSVLYNIAVANRIDDLAGDDEDFVTLTSLDVDLDDLDAPTTQRRLVVEPAAPEPETPPLTEHPGFCALRQALQARLRSDTGKPGPAWTIAMSADLSKLEDEDRRALLCEPETLAAPSLQNMLVVALAHGQRPAIDAELAELEIDVDVFEDDWVPDVRGALRADIRDLILAGRYDETRAPSETLTRLLPVWATSEGARRKAARPVALPTISFDLLNLRAGLDQEVRKKARTWKMGGKPLLAAVLALIAMVMAARVIIGPMKMVHRLDAQELAAISPHLMSAQRDQLGFGTALFGKVDDAWHELDEVEKYELALEMTRRMRGERIRNAVISDAHRRLQIMILAGKLRSPREP